MRIRAVIIAFMIVVVTILSLRAASNDDKRLHRWVRNVGKPENLAGSYSPHKRNFCTGDKFVCTIVDFGDSTGVKPMLSWGDVSNHKLKYNATFSSHY